MENRESKSGHDMGGDAQRNITVRKALDKDKDAVLAFCQNTFNGSDFIASVWDRWLSEQNGQLFVGTVGERPVALLRVCFLDAVAWMEGMRVHPDFRRQGFGSVMITAGCDFARQRGRRLARLTTDITNVVAQKSVASLGYQKLEAQFIGWAAEPEPIDYSSIRAATEADLPSILSLWNQSGIRAASCDIVPDSHWRWSKLNEETLLKLIRDDNARIAPNGFTLALYTRDNGGHMSIHSLAGDKEAVSVLARGVRGEARARGFASVGALLADCPLLNETMELVGFKRNGGMLVYEKQL